MAVNKNFYSLKQKLCSKQINCMLRQAINAYDNFDDTKAEFIVNQIIRSINDKNNQVVIKLNNWIIGKEVLPERF